MTTAELSTEDKHRVTSRLQQFAGTGLDQLLEPIEGDSPVGEFLKGNGVYGAIKDARNADDPNLPMGDWQHNLKIADWELVSHISVDALTHKSKDLQIGVWFLESQVNLHGFAGLAPALLFLIEMTDKFWSDLYPQIDEGDLDYRTNLIAWLNDKLQPVIRQLPITQAQGRDQYCWADWEMALQHEHLTEKELNKLSHFVSSQQITQSMLSTPIDFYRQLYQDTTDGILMLERFSAVLDQLCQEQAPSLTGITDLIQEIRATTAAQVQHKGLFAAPAEPDEDTIADQTGQPPPAGGGNKPISSRELAYAQLAEAAEYLMQEDAHSPVPYLVFKAIEWGKLNTADLYQELFIQYQGQLNIFEILGLDPNTSK